MSVKNLNQLYCEQLLKVGVTPQKAEYAAKILTREELQLIREVWSEWATTVSQVEAESAVGILVGV